MPSAEREARIADTAAAPGASETRGAFWFALLSGLLGILVLAALGTWQVERLGWKERILATIDARIHAAPVPVAAIGSRLAAGEDVDYVPASATGRFLHGGERHFLSTFEGQAGWNVYTPLLLDAGGVLFVNRGFVPYELKDPARRSAGQIEGTVTVTGLVRTAPTGKSSSFSPDNDIAKNTFFWRSLPEMSAGLARPAGAAILPFFLDAGAGRAPGGWPVGGTTILDIPNNHLQYAVTWYGLALVLAVMLGAWLVRRRREAAGRAPAKLPAEAPAEG